jgi:hypothetical protein
MKKILLLLTISATLLSCNKVKKGEFLIEGTAKGVANGKTAILQKMDQMMGSIAIDTAVIKDGKFILKGKIEEPTLCFIQIQDAQGQVRVIAESDAVTVNVDKDTIQNSKVGGSYNNEEFQKFNDDMKLQQKPIMKLNKAFGDKNKALIDGLQQKQMAKIALNKADSLVIEKLNAEYEPIKQVAEKAGKDSNEKLIAYVTKHPKSYISVLMMQELMNSTEFEKFKKMFDGLDASLKATKPGKDIKTAIDGYKKPEASMGMGPQQGAPAPQAAPAQ